MNEHLHEDITAVSAVFFTLHGLWRQALLDLTGWTPERLDSALSFLESRGMLQSSVAQAHTYSIPDEVELQALVQRGVAAGHLRRQSGLFFKYFLLDSQQKPEQALSTLLNLHLSLRAEGQESTAACLFPLFLDRLSRLSLVEEDSPQARFFVDMCIDVQPGYCARPRDLQRFLYFLQKALTLAVRMGDKRSKLLVLLTTGSVSMQCKSQAARPDTFELMQLGEEVSRELGDQDILTRVSYYRLYYDFFCGNFQRIENSSFLSPLVYQLDRKSNRHVESAIALFRASCMTLLGKPKTAAKLLQSELGLLRYHQPKDVDHILRVQLAHVLLSAGQGEEAHKLLMEISEAVKDIPYGLIHSGIAQGLAYYHYQKGEIPAAHAVFYAAAETATAGGTPFWPLYFSPWQMEIGFAYERAGLTPGPGKETKDVLHYQLQGVSRFMHCMALRLQAESRFSEGAPPDEVLADCAKSLEIARAMGLPGETAKGHIFMAKVLRSAGLQKDALENAKLAARAWGSTQEHIPWPQELLEMGLRPFKCIEPEVSIAQSFLTRYFNSIYFIISSRNMQEMHDGLVRVSTALFGAKRGELYLQDAPDGEIINVASFMENPDIPHRPVEESLVRRVLRKKPGVYRQENPGPGGMEESVHILIPIYTNGSSSYVLHHELDPAHPCPSPETSAVYPTVAEGLSVIVDNIQRIFSRYDELRAAIGQASAVLADSDGVQLDSPAMSGVQRKAHLVATTDASVLITGESGVGKEVIAKFIHAQSGRIGPFVAVNLASVPSELFESELFGYEKGAFTGAHSQKLGLMQLAHNGTLFLDEIGEISPHFQVKLLRALEEKSFMRVGGRQLIQSDFRLIAATNQDMHQLVASGAFREDLYYRICVVPLLVPPLRERPEDILQMARHFLAHFSRHHKRPVPLDLTWRQQEQLLAYPWPGNVRELRNTIERAVLLHDGRELSFSLGESMAQREEAASPATAAPGLFPDQISIHEAPVPGREAPPPNNDRSAGAAEGDPFLPATQTLRVLPPNGKDLVFNGLPDLGQLKKAYVEHVARLTKGRVDGVDGAAGILGLSRASAYKLLKQYGLTGKAWPEKGKAEA